MPTDMSPRLYSGILAVESWGFYYSFRRETIASGNTWTGDIRRDISSELMVLDMKMGYMAITRNNDQPEPVMHALHDGICVAYLAWILDHTMVNSAARAGAITGDLWHFCGHGWYWSGKAFNGKELRCGWMDGDNTNGLSVYRIALNTDVLGSGYFRSYAENHPNSGDICGSGVKFFPGSPHYRDRRRSVPRDDYGNKAYVTAGAGAIELCDSSTSRGPSMLSLKERIFCDMATKNKVPLCRDGQSEGCMTYNGSSRKKRDLDGPHGTVAAVNVSHDGVSHSFYDLKYFVISDVNGTIIDDGSQ